VMQLLGENSIIDRAFGRRFQARITIAWQTQWGR
jgi:hypothetical protein